MKKTAYTILLLISPLYLLAQNSTEIIQRIQQQQEKIKNLSYKIDRIDTIGATIRKMSGKAAFEKKATDTIFGFKFWAEKQGDSINKVYDGKVGYSIDKLKKNYEITTSTIGFKNLLMGGGGHMVVPDLLKLDTSNASSISLKEDRNHYILKIKYPDLEQYDVINRYKEIYVDKTNFLLTSVREHQESYDRIQDLYYEISQLKINEAALKYNFSEPAFLSNYTHSVPERKANPIYKLIGKEMPEFKLKDFNGNEVNSKDFENKVVLLDFWEVWCGPCIEAMPKIEALHKKYVSKGLLIYGIVNDPENIDANKKMAKTRELTFPNLVGSEKITQDFKLSSIPLYMIIDRNGIIIFISEGYSDIIEETLVKALST